MLPGSNFMEASHTPATAMVIIDPTNTFPAIACWRDPFRKNAARNPDGMANVPAQM
jgi:hypothetical protein